MAEGMNGWEQATLSTVPKDPAVQQALIELTSKIQAAHEAGSEYEKLIAVRDCAATLESLGDDEAIHDLREMSYLVGIGDDVMSKIVDQGLDLGMERRSARTTGVYQDASGLHETQSPKSVPIIEPLEMFDAGDWEGVPLEPRIWLTNGQIPLGEPGILSGDGGTGKTTIAIQLTVSVTASWPDWLGKCIDMHGPAIFYTVEEKRAEIHRKVAWTLESRGQSFDKVRNKLFIISDQKNEPILARTDRDGIVHPTQTMLRLEKSIEKVKPVLVVIENAADVFAGNENDRSQVHPFVRQHIGGACNISGATGMLLQHPSVGGLVDGTGRSGSTGWNNAGRWRINFTTPKRKNDDDDDGMDDGCRILQTVKTNYGRRGEKIIVQWQDGIFIPEGSSTPVQRAARAAAETTFLDLLDEFARSGRRVSATKAAHTYAPPAFAKTEKGKPIGKGRLEGAMERLFSAGTIRLGKNPDVKPSKATNVILRAEVS